ncbi:MAG: hypothetical protein GW779_01565 [Candidatus Altiarchaeum hamiconexum]|uniref:Schlafen AlbA-2 domain-containing protein n=1 Tax=Candidatus Altarchaeum hamiconexum TaxID=1803513 RepID=A0A8J7YZF6_9ARCH|nr:hypothetical protein [Candidatus Altarchaeum hamiconexum]PIN68039.1 MAG: hypothetical protein COV98_00680 [Candidatus Altarchaeum sp. CG12_big_fil_rev_8_21_14_0_65_33_22]PIV28973.1 MAG: hypothetical protein COS36_00270 [Candidatus Altarchaeum sp. CG03_land_8_20_14_0_80_32_618]PIX49175.1 MAG: hypothetical protein COZ53_01410 [Candidatus Altarchaeum sp. CG_4_8_14_3_um_filter_33_2054]PIZ30455.1 MAG: hypothetical protein COY41_03980 [Candidatus Altarchaeum sp. CG_4_10_14_0_8_um_filter_32_851]
MVEENLKQILEEDEGYKIEFKENLSNIDKEIVAFANASGDRIFVGVDDNSNVLGIETTNELRSKIHDIANNCDPKIKIFIEKFENIFIINVREGTNKPYKCSSGFYKCIYLNSQKLVRDEILELFKSEGKVRFDETIEPKFQYPEDFDEDKFHRFLELAELSKPKKQDNIGNILINLCVAEKQEGRMYFNNAGILFFAKNPQRFIPWSVYTVVLFKDYLGADIIDRKEIDGSLFDIVESVMKFVKLYSKVAYKFTGEAYRENIYKYQFEAIREAVINSVMHKYYFEHGHNNILRFLPDRIRIENFWLKPTHFVLGKTVFRRNHLIADLFARIHFGEKLGTGFERIENICKAENAPFPEMECEENYFYSTFKQGEEYLKMAGRQEASREKKVEIGVEDLFVAANASVEGVNEGVNEGVKKRLINELVYLVRNNFVNHSAIENLWDISTATAERDISLLKKLGFIKFTGAPKTGKYVLTEKWKKIIAEVTAKK